MFAFIGLIAITSAPALASPLLPDPELTPGVIATIDLGEICVRSAGAGSYAQRHRQTTIELKNQVMRKYGLASRQGDEIDHRVPLCLGGADVAQNLWVQSYTGPWNAHRKDALEAYACREVCAGKVALSVAQGWFTAPDWRVGYCLVFDDSDCPPR